MTLRSWTLSLAAVCALALSPCLASAAVSAHPAIDSPSLPVAAGDCSLSTLLPDNPEVVPATTCSAAFCASVQDCIDACPEATSASCDFNICNYDSSGGNGGPGPGCSGSFCTTAGDCLAACPQATFAACVANVCQY